MRPQIAPHTLAGMQASESPRGAIIAGIDGSDRSFDASALARALSRATGAPLLLAAVYPVGGAPEGDALRERANDALTRARERYHDAAGIEASRSGSSG